MKLGRIELPGAVVAGLLLAILLDTVIQIVWKLAVPRTSAGGTLAATIGATLANPFFYLAMLAFGAQLFNWTRVLARADLSFAQPFTALGYITVLAISWRFLHEPMSGFKLIGVAAILVGVFFISQTPYQSFRTRSDAPVKADAIER